MTTTSDNMMEAIELEFDGEQETSPATSDLTCKTPPRVESDLRKVVWSDITENDTGVLLIQGHVVSLLKANQLRGICSSLVGVSKGLQQPKKAVLIERIRYYRKQLEGHKNLVAEVLIQNTEDPSAPRKEPQCVYRLLNILFSDQFATEFEALGNTSTREQLDTGTAASDKHFWIHIRDAFVDSTDKNHVSEYGDLRFKDDAAFAKDTEYINPRVIVRHDWSKLRDIWKKVNAEYKIIISKFTQSGTHENEFWKYCKGNLAAYYLRKLLCIRPGLNAFVEADLPAVTALSSENSSFLTVAVDAPSIESSTLATPVAIKRMRLSRNAVLSAKNAAHTKLLTDAIGSINKEDDLHSAKMLSTQSYQDNEEKRRVDEELRQVVEVELFQHKEELRRVVEVELQHKEELRRVVEVELQHKEDARRDEELAHREKESAFVAYDRCNAMIASITAQLRDPDISNEDKDELTVDRKSFKKLKVEAAKVLHRG